MVTLPWSVLITQAGPPNYAYSLFLIGNSATTGEASFGLRAQFATVDAKAGKGPRTALATPIRRVADVAMADQAVVPLFYQDNVFATRKGYRLAPRADGFMAAFMITPE